jgi:hypothetical protein
MSLKNNLITSLMLFAMLNSSLFCALANPSSYTAQNNMPRKFEQWWPVAPSHATISFTAAVQSGILHDLQIMLSEKNEIKWLDRTDAPSPDRDDLIIQLGSVNNNGSGVLLNLGGWRWHSNTNPGAIAAAGGGQCLQIAGAGKLPVNAQQAVEVIISIDVPAKSIVASARPAGSTDAYQVVMNYPISNVPAKDWRYVSFCSYQAVINITNLRITTDVVVPVGFDDEIGATDSIAVGGSDIYCISLDGKQLLSYNNESMNPNPWEPVALTGLPAVVNNGVSAPVTLEAVTCGGDNTVCILDANGAAYRLAVANDGQSANCLAIPSTGTPARIITSIAVGSAKDIWAVDSNKNVLQHNGSDWVVRAAGVGQDVAVGADGHVVAINTAGDPFFFHNGGWAKLPVLPNDLNIEQIAVVKAGDLYAVSEDNVLWRYNTPAAVAGQPAPQAAWRTLQDASGKIAKGYTNVAVNAGGTVFAITTNNEIYNTEIVEVEVAPAPAPAPLATAPTLPTAAPAPAPAIESAAVTGAVVAPPVVTNVAGVNVVSKNVVKKAAGKRAAKKAAAAGKTTGGKAAADKAPGQKTVTRAQAKKSGKINVKAQKAAVKAAAAASAATGVAPTSPTPAPSKVKAIKKAGKAQAKKAKAAVKKAAAKTAANPATKVAKKATAKKAAQSATEQATTTPKKAAGKKAAGKKAAKKAAAKKAAATNQSTTAQVVEVAETDVAQTEVAETEVTDAPVAVE